MRNLSDMGLRSQSYVTMTCPELIATESDMVESIRRYGKGQPVEAKGF